uniref:aralkylamine N-acetyltransferase n=1 Tax=Glossina palpalis gambiensis TaxID=67801 RepID=A0A1B0C7Q7_9MUSC
MLSATAQPDDIQIRLIKSEDGQRVLNFLRAYFYPEDPVTLGIEPKRQDAADEEYNIGMIEHSISLMAVRSASQNSKESSGEDRIVGVIIVGPKDATEADHLYDAARKEGYTKWGRILQLLERIERDANVCERYKIQKVLHIHALSVNVNMRGRNIGARMIKELIGLAKHVKYEAITIDCSSFYAIKLMERLNFECINTLYYNEYVDENHKPIFQTEPPHTCIKTYVYILQRFEDH